MNRRELIQKFLMGGTVLVLVPTVIESCTKNSSIDGMTTPGQLQGRTLEIDLSLDQNKALNTAGNSKVFNNNIIVINTNTSFVALSSICTHQGCTVQYNTQSGNLECPCHGSKFQISGNVLLGPATVALPSYTVARKDNLLTVEY